MSITKLIFSSLKHYIKANLGIAMGVAISTAVIAGALIVGDSVSYSLEQATHYRLGNIETTVTAGDRYFTPSLSEKLNTEGKGEFSSVLHLSGLAKVQQQQKPLSKVQVWGVDSDFKTVIGSDYAFDSLSYDETVISENVAEELGLKVNDEYILKINKLSVIPLNAPFVSADDQVVRRNVIVKAIIGKEELSRLNLHNSQTAPYNIFCSLAGLSEMMDIENKANLILSNSSDVDEETIRKNIGIKDVNLLIDTIGEVLQITSERVFIDNAISSAILESFPQAQAQLSYFVNGIKSDKSSCPYSFVSTKPELKANEIVLSSWLATDIQAAVGDEIILSYFVVGPLRTLDTASTRFIVTAIFSIKGSELEKKLMPDFPGLSDAGNCKEWNTGIPVDLDAIREKDEDYWELYKGTPKAYISKDKAVELWDNRFGTFTSLRLPLSDQHQTAAQILDPIDPFELGFQINNVKQDGLFAAHNGTDFSGLFIGLSFFIIVAGLLLTVLLFLFNLDIRSEQIGSLSAVGLSEKLIRRIFIGEAFIVSFFGAMMGLGLAVLYNKLIFFALNGIWQDIVRTQVLVSHIQFNTLLLGFVISMILILVTLRLSLSKRMKRQIAQLQNRTEDFQRKWLESIKFISMNLLTLFGLTAVVMQLLNKNSINELAFFASGGSLLFAFILFVDYLFTQWSKHPLRKLSLFKLSYRNMILNRRRSLMVVILLSLGAFLVISTGANRKDLFANASEKTSGTGGYDYFAESTLPVLSDLNSKEGKFEFSIADSTRIVQMRTKQGDDASCLNLNRIERPRILGVDAAQLQGRFSFATKTELLDENNPWLSLDQESSAFIPAVADQTVIQWSLGKKVGDTLTYKNEMGEEIYLKLIGGLSASVFQGNILISNEQFLKHFPSSSGSNVFLISADTANAQEDYALSFKEHGWDMKWAAERLANFKTVENTYLSIFLILGVLGLLLGTIGLAVVLARSIYERRSEFATLQALGYSSKHIFYLVFMEYTYLLFFGLMAGGLSALIAVYPSIAKASQLSFSLLIGLMLFLFGNGIVWILVIAKRQLSNIKIYKDIASE